METKKEGSRTRKNVLIISYGYPPLNDAGVQRPYALAKHLNKSKFNVKVITCKNPRAPLGINEGFDPTLEDVDLIRIKSYFGNSLNSVTTHKVKEKRLKIALKKLVFNVGQRLVFPDKAAFWYPNVKKYLKDNSVLIKETDIVFSTSPGVTNHRIALFLKRQNPNICWVADFRDFHYVKNWNNQKNLKAVFHRKLENSIIKEATSLVFVTNTMLREYKKFYPNYRERMHCIYNGFDRINFSNIDDTTSNDKRLSFFYGGSFYKGLRSPFPLLQLLDAALQENLLTKQEVQIDIAGSIGDETKLLMKEYSSYDCIRFLGNVPRMEVLKSLSKYTFLWLIVANIESHYQTVPIKLFEYIAAQRPIVNFAPFESESSQIVSANNLGYNFNTLDFNLNESYSVFCDLIFRYRRGDFNSALVANDLNSFTWENQIRLIEDLLIT